MAAPITGEFNSISPHLTLIDLNAPNSVEDNLTFDQLNKRTRSKRSRFEVSQSDVQHDHSAPINIVLNNPSRPTSSSLKKQTPPTKGFKPSILSSSVMARAMVVRRRLGNDFPICVKMMCKSQVSSGFWMGLPLWFCKIVLPKEDATLVLEDENEEQCEVKYIAYKHGLSAGWKNFVIRHKLVEEDVLVFRLVETRKFKVYILKANEYNETSHDLSLLTSEAHTEQTTPVTPSSKTKKNKHQESLPSTEIPKKRKRSSLYSRSIPSSSQHIENSRNESEEGGSKVLECSLSFQQVKSFKYFHIVVNGVYIDDELPNDVRLGYYKLCCYKKDFLHDCVPKSKNYKLVAGMIGETVSIANEIKNCKLTTKKEEFETWDTSLKSFELLGMKVCFLRDKIHTLAALVFESEGALDIKQYVEAKEEHKRVEDEIKKVAAKLKELREHARNFDGVVGCMKLKAEKYEREFQREVDALPF